MTVQTPSDLIRSDSDAAAYTIIRLYISRSGLLPVPERLFCCTLASPVCWCHRRVSIVIHDHKHNSQMHYEFAGAYAGVS